MELRFSLESNFGETSKGLIFIGLEVSMGETGGGSEIVMSPSGSVVSGIDKRRLFSSNQTSQLIRIFRV